MPAKKIMVVEDESVISLDIRNSLVKMGYTVSGVAATGESALMKITKNRPDLVLMDIHLKGNMSGIDVSEKIKADLQIPVVYLTANADSSTFQEAKETDPYGYLLKPFAEKELGIAIEIALNKHSKEQTIRSSERWYASAFQSFSEAVIATDCMGRVVYMNRLAEVITGWTLLDVLDKPLVSILTFHRKIQQLDHVDIQESVDSLLAATLRGQKAIALPHQSQLLTKCKKMVCVEGSVTGIKDSEGTVIGSLFSFNESKDKKGDTKNDDIKNSRPKQPRSAKSLAVQHPSNASQGSHTLANTQSLARQKSKVDNDDTILIESFIQAFINEDFAILSTARLVANCGDRTATLSDRKEGVIVSVKCIDNTITAIVSQKSRYWEVIRHLLIENSYFPISRRTNGTCYYQYRALPEQCQVFHTSAMKLGEAWYGKWDSQLSGNSASLEHTEKLRRENIVVLRRGSWYHIQTMVTAEDNIRIKTVGGDIFATPEDLLVWGVQNWF